MTTESQVTVIRAAGGVVWRVNGDDRQRRIALVHRPRYDDWSLPKGKLEPGEHPMVAAVREVREESAIRAVPQARLSTVRYRIGMSGAEKTVEYWSMRAVAWRHRPRDQEVDLVRWVRPAEAFGLLTYPQDRHMVRAFVERPPVTGLVALVRHAGAADAKGWPGPDAARPLTPEGVERSEALVPVLALLDVARVVSAPQIRCVQTVTPLATLVDVPPEPDVRFDAGTEPATSAAALTELAAGESATVVCGQNEMISRVLALLTGRDASDFSTGYGEGWLVAFAEETVTAASRFTPSRD